MEKCPLQKPSRVMTIARPNPHSCRSCEPAQVHASAMRATHRDSIQSITPSPSRVDADNGQHRPQKELIVRWPYALSLDFLHRISL